MFSYLKKEMPKTFSKLVKAYHFMSKHPKFEAEFPRDGSKPPHNHPYFIRKNNLPQWLKIILILGF